MPRQIRWAWCDDGEACDRRECEAEELVIPAEGRIYDACMRAKGYR